MDLFGIVLSTLVALMVAGAVGLASYWAYETYISRLVGELQGEAALSGGNASSVMVRKMGSFNRALMWPSYEANMRRMLIRAGNPGNYQPEDILGMQEIGAVVGLFCGLILMNGIGYNLAWSLLIAALGGMVPYIWVNDQVKKRHLQIQRALPYNLDLLTLSVEAGLDFTGALAKVVEKGKTGPLRDELQMVLKQLKMGKSREEGLKSMVARVDLPSLSTFVNALIQADKMGTSLGKVLRIQSTQMRLDRTQRAEKLANEAPVKMLLPLILCIFPTVFLILFGPIVFSFIFGHAAG